MPTKVVAVILVAWMIAIGVYVALNGKNSIKEKDNHLAGLTGIYEPPVGCRDVQPVAGGQIPTACASARYSVGFVVDVGLPPLNHRGSEWIRVNDDAVQVDWPNLPGLLVLRVIPKAFAPTGH